VSALPTSADGRLSRRELLRAGALAAGYALAAQPVRAAAVHTGEEGLVAGPVEIPVEGAPMPAYRARPVAGESWPVVLVVHEIFGVHEYVQDVCRRLAQQGYLAVAPDLYRRVGDVTQIPEVGRIVDEVVARVPDATVLTDLDAALAWAAEQGGDPKRSFVVGFCWGGRIVWLYAAQHPELAAGAAWYGRLEGAERPETPKHPLDLAAEPLAPVLGLYGGQDAGIPLESVDRMRKKLHQADQASEILVFPTAPHGFHADYRDSYRSLAAREGWRRMLEWFQRHGGA